jgi:hypothetical protein
MIDAALGLMAGQLNEHLRRRFQLGEDLAVLSNLLEQNGTLVPLVANKLVMFLAGVERDTLAHRAPGAQSAPNPPPSPGRFRPCGPRRSQSGSIGSRANCSQSGFGATSLKPRFDQQRHGTPSPDMHTLGYGASAGLVRRARTSGASRVLQGRGRAAAAPRIGVSTAAMAGPIEARRDANGTHRHRGAALRRRRPQRPPGQHGSQAPAAGRLAPRVRFTTGPTLSPRPR